MLVTGRAGEEELIYWSRLLVSPDDEAPPLENSEAIELSEPRRLVEVTENVPPNPEKPSVAGLDSSGNRRPVRVILESHMRR